MSIVLNLILLSSTIFIISKMMPSIHIKSFWTAVSVAVVYSIINWLVGWFLVFVTLPLIFITFGLFKFVINAFLLWVTDQLIEDFEIEGIGNTLIAAFLIAVADSILRLIF